MSALRYDTRTVANAQRLADAGWSLRRIQSIMEKEYGVRPARDTLKTWTDPEFAERRRAEHRRKRTKQRVENWNFRMGGSKATREYQEAFICRLDLAGVPMQSIAKVCTVVFPDDGWTRARVAYLLGRPT